MEGFFEKVTFGQEFKGGEEGTVYIFERAVTGGPCQHEFQLREFERDEKEWK